MNDQRPCSPVRKQLKPSLEPNRRPNPHLIVIKAEEIDVARVLAVQVVYPGAQPSSNQHVKGRLDKPVIIIPRAR